MYCMLHVSCIFLILCVHVLSTVCNARGKNVCLHMCVHACFCACVRDSPSLSLVQTCKYAPTSTNMYIYIYMCVCMYMYMIMYMYMLAAGLPYVRFCVFFGRWGGVGWGGVG